MEATIRQLGNSDGVILRKDLLSKLGISRGDRVNVECVDNKIVISPVRTRLKLEARLNGQKAPEGYTVEDWGDPVGREVW